MLVTRQPFFVMIAVFLCFCLASCDKVDELLDPKTGDDKLEDLMTAGIWRADSIRYGHIEQGNTVLDTIKLSMGTFKFGTRSKETGINYGVGLVEHAYTMTDSLGTRTKIDTLHWYAGNWGSISLDGKVVTLFMARNRDGSFDTETDLHLDFLRRERNNIILDGRRGYTNFSNGAISGFYRRFSLSR